MSDVKKEGWALFRAALFVAASAGAAWLVFQIPSAGGDTCGSASEAYAMSQNPARQMLKSPSTADFPGITAQGVSVTHEPPCSYIIRAYVDAQNGFGATVRTPYTATMTRNPETGAWATVSLALDD